VFGVANSAFDSWHMLVRYMIASISVVKS
jgi:hypothetical protein